MKILEQILQYLKLKVSNELKIAKLFVDKKRGVIEKYAYQHLVENLEPLLFNIFEDVKHQYKRTHDMRQFEQELFADLEEELRKVIVKHAKK